jgi:mono/diheme cytochrome c family protein
MALVTVLGLSIKNDSSAASAADQDLPEGKGVEIVRDKCISCHEADLIVSQRLSQQGWLREVDKMIRWGAVVTENEKEPLISYLSMNFGPRSDKTIPSTKEQDDRGRGIFQNKCLVCHETDLTEQQRLSRTGWTREVEKMIRWGAAVTEEEKGPLIDYLVEKYGTRSR